MIDWLKRLRKRLRCEHTWDKGFLINMGMQKMFTCTKCEKRSIF